MDITWHGHSCFTIKGNEASILIDPYDGIGNMLPKTLKANIVTFGDALAGKEGKRVEVEGAKVLDWPGEFEVANVAIEAFSAHRFAKEGDGEGDQVNIFIFAIDRIKVCHLSGLAHELSDDLLDRIGDVDILLLPVGGGEVLDGKTAQKVLEAVEPRVVIPMYYNATDTKFKIGGSEEFLKAVGEMNLEAEGKFSVKSKSDLPDGSMEFALLTPTA